MANNTNLINHQQHLIMDIVSRLPVDSVFRCRCVCKSWQALLHEPYFTQMHTDRTLLQQQHHPDPAAAYDSPVSFLNLVYYIPRRHFEVHLEDYYIKHEQQHHHTSYNHNKKVISTNKYHKKVISRPALNPTPILLRTGQCLKGPIRWLILGSCNGLICFYGNNYLTADSYIIYNPITKEYVNLRGDADPESILINKTASCYRKFAYGFGYHPSTKEYKIVKIIYDDRWRIQIYTLGSGKWRIKKQELDETRCPTPFFYHNNCRGVYVNGAIYWVTRVKQERMSYDMAENIMTKTHIISFYLADEKLKIIPSPPPRSISDVRLGLPSYLISSNILLRVPLNLFCNELGVLEQHLCMFQHATLSTDIWVMNHNNFYGGDDQCLWSKKFSIPLPNPRTHYEPIGLTKKGAVLCFHDNSYLISFDPRTKTWESMGKVCLFDARLRISYTKSIVSLKALGEENAEIDKSMNKKKHSASSINTTSTGYSSTSYMGRRS